MFYPAFSRQALKRWIWGNVNSKKYIFRFWKVNFASIGATWPYQASPKLNNVTHFPSIAVHICNTWHYRLPADLTKCHTLLAPTKNCKINHFYGEKNNCQLFLPPTKKPLKMDFRFPLKQQHLDWIKYCCNYSYWFSFCWR